MEFLALDLTRNALLLALLVVQCLILKEMLERKERGEPDMSHGHKHCTIQDTSYPREA